MNCTPSIEIQENIVAIAEVECDRPIEIIQEGVRVIQLGGGGGTYYSHSQPTPSLVWIINHNQGIYLNPEAYNNGGQQILGEVLQLSVNHLQISFLAPQSGFAHLS